MAKEEKVSIVELRKNERVFTMTIHNVLDFHLVGDGVTDNSEMLAKMIEFLDQDATIYFPSGKYVLSDTIQLTKRINILGESWQSILLRSSTLINKPMIRCTYPNSLESGALSISTITLNNGEENPTVSPEEHGIYVENSQNLFIEKVCVMNQGGSGIKLGGSNLNNTVEINDSYIRYNKIHGIQVENYCSDIHIHHCDIGSNENDNIRFEGTSSTIKNSVIWGSKKECGVVILGQSNHISNCQIEGNARHAIVINRTSHCSIRSNKIYASVWAGTYGIYIGNSENNQVENIFIQGNMIYSSLAEGYSTFTRAIYIQPFHKNIKVFDNNLSYLGIGKEEPTQRPYVEGLSMNKGDKWNNIDDPLFVNATMDSNSVLVSNVNTQLFFKDVSIDLSQILEEGILKIREDGIYSLSGIVNLVDITAANQTKLSLFLNNTLSDTIHYYGKDTPKSIEFSKNLILKAGDTLALSIVIIGTNSAVSKNSNLTFIKFS